MGLGTRLPFHTKFRPHKVVASTSTVHSFSFSGQWSLLVKYMYLMPDSDSVVSQS